MTPPAESFRWLLAAFGAGAVLGLFHSFLRPLRRKISWGPDLIFVLAMFAAWLYLGFGVCGGDLRLGWLAGVFGGIVLFDALPGRLLRPVFAGFWKSMEQITSCILWPFKKILKKSKKIAKNIFSTMKKWSTIRWNDPDHLVNKTGGRHGKAGTDPQPYPHRSQTQQQTDQSGSGVQRRAVYGGPAGTGQHDPGF